MHNIADVVREENTIVGVDPGITTGVAILDTDGKILVVKSWRNIKKGEIIKFIMKYGRPLVVASDVRPVPKGVEKIARSLGCRIFTPEKEISVLEKSQLVKHWMEKYYATRTTKTKDIKNIGNSHENDAFVAAIKAYNAYNKIFGKVGRALGETALKQAFGDVAKSVLFRRTSSVREGVMGWLKRAGKDEKNQNKKN